MKSTINDLDSDGWSLWGDLPHDLRYWVFFRFQTMEVPELRWCRNGLRFWGGCWLRESSCECFAKRSWGFSQSLKSIAVHFRAGRFGSVLMDLSVLLLMPFPIEPVTPKRTLVGVCLMVSTTVRTLEQVGAWFLFFCFQSWQVDLGISLAVPSKFSVVFWFVRPIAFDAFSPLNSAQKCCVTPLLAIFALWYTGVHVGSLDGRDIVTDVETPVDEHFCITTTLYVPYI